MILSNIEDSLSSFMGQSYNNDLMKTAQMLIQLQSNNYDFEELKNSLNHKNIWINRLQQSFASSDQSNFINEKDDIDIIHDIEDIATEVKDSVKSQIDFSYKYQDDSTNSRDVNAANNAFEKMLNQRTPAFVWSILHVDFEDGMYNSVIEEVKYYLKENEYVTILWLHTIFSQNQHNQNILAALLRIIAMTIKSEKSDKLMTMVISGLNQPSSKTQEAALEVIEEWRTKPCLDALHNLHYRSCWIEKYATIVEKELEEELQC
ncbi:hypothetical protein QUW55_14035 [Phocaeicola barnesiae]|uniref:hypothetical protein n=1 Tax=Phocaeicola barnesiae TaxID=376804 RepID=UPI0025A3A7DE|nr:hypothetical protein [Phocaeicola barnesiae]MDM8252708.1 hypothetical protein [Phocaeicola barnesiae]